MPQKGVFVGKTYNYSEKGKSMFSDKPIAEKAAVVVKEKQERVEKQEQTIVSTSLQSEFREMLNKNPEIVGIKKWAKDHKNAVGDVRYFSTKGRQRYIDDIMTRLDIPEDNKHA